MAFRSVKKDIDKIYQKIDKISKVGRDNFQEYYNYVDNMIFKSQYGLLTQVLYIKYDFDYNKYISVNQVKSKSWLIILSKTNTSLQDNKYKLLKDNDVYQIGLVYYKQLDITTARVVDSYGSGADLKPIIENGGVIQIDVLKSGKDYSTASTILITGGVTPATAYIPTPNGLRGGMILKVQVTATGSNHNQSLKLGTIEEFDLYLTQSEFSYTPSKFQEIIDNKILYLKVNKVSNTQSVIFSNWNYGNSYDKNVISLYTDAINYLI